MFFLCRRVGWQRWSQAWNSQGGVVMMNDMRIIDIYWGQFGSFWPLDRGRLLPLHQLMIRLRAARSSLIPTICCSEDLVVAVSIPFFMQMLTSIVMIATWDEFAVLATSNCIGLDWMVNIFKSLCVRVLLHIPNNSIASTVNLHDFNT